ncbi:MAG: hypothetical protein Kow0074_08340 [Candidatus Zixiibacteriota bacterium]
MASDLLASHHSISRSERAVISKSPSHMVLADLGDMPVIGDLRQCWPMPWLDIEEGRQFL